MEEPVLQGIWTKQYLPKKEKLIQKYVNIRAGNTNNKTTGNKKLRIDQDLLDFLAAGYISTFLGWTYQTRFIFQITDIGGVDIDKEANKKKKKISVCSDPAYTP